MADQTDDWRPRFSPEQREQFESFKDSKHENDKTTMDKILEMAGQLRHMDQGPSWGANQ